MRQIQNGITENDHQLLMLASEPASQRTISGLGHDSFSDPLPELSLSGPELLAIKADHESSFFLFRFLIFLFGPHSFVGLPVALGRANSVRGLKKLKRKWPASDILI